MKKVVSTAIAIVFFVITLFGQTDDEKSIKKNVSLMEEGWKEKDGKKYASPFADVHDFIVWNGYYFPNNTKVNNERSHQMLFDGPFKMRDIKLKVDKIKFIRPDIALVHVLGLGYDKGKELSKDPGVLISMVMEKKTGKWEIISFHNLDLEVFQDEMIKSRMPAPAEVMYANWYKN